ncbi:OLC1v1017432C4 [Oldenlandia corymbosa var. corymbosa]|uniref:OLC1v1017432C4 n=1 Tax=Oldenlandia corymbosa var. corymbosa TaxID=529605 RepID=A0AAV1E9E3_OLDCO|nr:OLC1v1017432C4 [Oldenlandia corymbosa var. corymbosa]
MERSTPVRKPHTSTADLLTWSETPPENTPASASAARSATRSHQPSDGIRKVVFGGQVTDEEVESLNKRKPCSDFKMKEITGSGIFAAGGENGVPESDIADGTSASKTGLRMYQQAVAGMSQISFGDEGAVTPKKPTTVPEVAKQRELSGNLETESEAEARLKKQLSDAKCKELSGHDIFAPPPEIKPRPLSARAPALRESITIGEAAARNVSAHSSCFLCCHGAFPFECASI